MNKLLIVIIFIFTLLTGCSIINNTINYAQITPPKELSCNDILKEAKKITLSINYCESDADCLIIEEYPFGCYYLTNKDADQSQFNELIKSFKDKKCPGLEFDCYNINLAAECKNNKCIVNE